jgi:hypothetical protein
LWWTSTTRSKTYAANVRSVRVSSWSTRRAIALATLTVLVAACSSVDEFHDPKVTNATGQPIDLAFVSNGVEVPLGSIGVNVTVSLTAFGGRCSNGTFIARVAGGEIARRSERLCPDEIWTIGAEPGSTGPPVSPS